MSMSLAGLRKVLDEACYEAGGQGAWAEKHGIDPAYVNRVLRGAQKPGRAILAALGFSLLQTGPRYERVESVRP